MDADAIHVGGRVHHFSIIDNRVFNRGDAGVAASSEVGDYVCSEGRIEGNVLIEDQVGLDNSGCTNTIWKGNFVRATIPPRGSNPAFRSITYLGLTSSNVTALGNYLQNGSGFGEYAAKVDEIAGKSGTKRVCLGQHNRLTLVTVSAWVTDGDSRQHICQQQLHGDDRLRWSAWGTY